MHELFNKNDDFRNLKNSISKEEKNKKEDEYF